MDKLPDFTITDTKCKNTDGISAEVFNLCHAVDPTEIPSLGGGPHGPKAHWLQPFVLLVGAEHVLLRLRTQTT